MNADGQVYEVASANGVPVKTSLDPVFKFSVFSSDFNALAVGAEGKVMWAVDRGNFLRRWPTVYRWDSVSQTQTQISNDYLPGGPLGALPRGNIVAGGISPTEANAEYHFGGFIRRPGDPNAYFLLYKYNGTTVVLVGHVRVDGSADTSGVDNGDLMFSASGDLFILWNNGKNTRLVPVLRDELARANGGEIKHGDISVLKTDETGYNGVAFDTDGRVFLQYDGANGNSWNHSADPDDGTSLSSKEDLGYKGGADLASCAAPPTLYVQKDVVGRKRPGDQFKISVEGKGSKVLSTVTTQGAGTGVQASIGVFVLYKPRTYKIKEVGVGGADLAGYQTTLSCVDKAGQAVAVTEVGRGEYTYTAAGGPSKDVVCTLRNAPTGSVRWQKTSAETGEALAASEWEIRPGDGSATVKVVDDSTTDQDKDPGEFEVADLPFGQYSLVETKAPTGYVAEGRKAFTIDQGNVGAPLDLGAITNRKVTATVTWSKTDSKGGALGGSVWVFASTSPAGSEQEVSDCAKAPCAAGGDRDQRPGYFKLEGVPFGTYSLKERSAPAGYVKSDGAKTVEVTTDGAVVEVGAVVNKRMARVSWFKTDAAGAALGGSVWTWRPKGAGNDQAVEVVDCTASPCAGADKAPAAGELLLEDIATGDYELVEKTAPAGYVLDATVHEVVVSDADADTTISVGELVNLPLGTVSWRKVDADSGKPLGGSSWTLTATKPAGAPQEVTDCVAADKAGCTGADKDPLAGGFKVEGLEHGEYALVERAAPVGYHLDTTAHTFTIGGGKEDHVFTDPFENHKTSVPSLPLTGGTGAHLFLIGGGLLAALAVSFGVVRRQVE